MNRFIDTNSKITVVDKVSSGIDPKKIKKMVRAVLTKNKAPQNSEVSIAITSDSELAELAARYLGERGEKAKSHPVLSFSSKEAGGFIVPKSRKNYLGEIIISWDKAVAESKDFDRSPGEIVADYAAHAALHLLGIHHR